MQYNSGPVNNKGVGKNFFKGGPKKVEPGLITKTGKFFEIWEVLARACENSAGHGPPLPMPMINNMVSKRYYLSYHFSQTYNSPSPCLFLGDNILLKNNQLEEMFIEKIIGFGLGTWPCMYSYN